MIYITGDTHANFSHRFSNAYFSDLKDMTKDDYVIIAGDFGGIWNQVESRSEEYWLDWFESRNYTLLFIDGNHENFDRLYKYPVKEWHGGKVHEIRPSVLHLMRGQVYDIDGKTIFTFGGASSHDIRGGILELDDPDYFIKKKKNEENWIPYRVNHHSWWKEELPSKEEMDEGLANLARVGNQVDIIITHCCSTSTQDAIGGKGLYKPDIETDYLEQIKQNVDYKCWYFGHYHIDQEVNGKEVVLYKRLVKM